MTTKASLRDRLKAALDKPLPEKDYVVHSEVFNPWEDIISGIYGSYAFESDALMIGALEAIRDRNASYYIEQHGFAAEFMFYVLAGHGFLEYGTSPRSGWPNATIVNLWDDLIEKWKAYASIVWDRDMDASPPLNKK